MCFNQIYPFSTPSTLVSPLSLHQFCLPLNIMHSFSLNLLSPLNLLVCHGIEPATGARVALETGSLTEPEAHRGAWANWSTILSDSFVST